MRVNDQTCNRLSVLKAIRHDGPISRSELPTLTGLSGGTITQLTSDLTSRGLILESKLPKMGRGRPRALLEINAAGMIVVGVSVFGRAEIALAFVDLTGNRVFSSKAKLGMPTTWQEFGDALAQRLCEAIDTSPYTLTDIGRIGIAMPAEIDCYRGIVHSMTMMPPGPVSLAEIVARNVGLPVTIESDAVCMARAEHWFGRAQDYDSFTMLHVGFGIDSAQYVNGLPKFGNNGFNAALGHSKTAIGTDALDCLCGAKGCLMAYSSMFGILSHAHLLEGTSFPPVESLDSRFSAFLDRAEKGEREPLAALASAGYHLGMAISNHINAADPGTVLILASHPRYHQFTGDVLRDTVKKNTLPGVYSQTNLQFGVSDEDWRWKGSAALALEKTYLSDV